MPTLPTHAHHQPSPWAMGSVTSRQAVSFYFTSKSPTQTSKIQTDPIKGLEARHSELSISLLAEGKQEVIFNPSCRLAGKTVGSSNHLNSRHPLKALIWFLFLKPPTAVSETHLPPLTKDPKCSQNSWYMFTEEMDGFTYPTNVQATVSFFHS